MFAKASAIILIAFFAVVGFAADTAYAADTGRTYVAPPSTDGLAALPFSSGVMVNGTYYISGHIGIDPATGKVATNVEAEARLVMDSVKHTLERAGLRMDDLVSVTVYCADLDLYEKFNAVYRTYFHEHYPARAFIGINKLVLGAHFEVAGVAVAPTRSHKL